MSCDFFETVTLTGARMSVFTVIEHASRRIRILGATAHPTASWMAQVRTASSGSTSGDEIAWAASFTSMKMLPELHGWGFRQAQGRMDRAAMAHPRT